MMKIVRKVLGITANYCVLENYYNFDMSMTNQLCTGQTQEHLKTTN